MFFDSWAEIARVVIVGVFAYLALVILPRVSGKRTLSKMNMFDFVVTIALGSTLASALLTEQVALVEAIVAFATLIFLQFVLTWLSVRSRFVSDLVKSQPTLLYYQGEFLREAMHRERVVEQEIYAAIRAQGIASIENVGAVVLETDGTFSALPKTAPGTQPNTLTYAHNYPVNQAQTSAD